MFSRRKSVSIHIPPNTTPFMIVFPFDMECKEFTFEKYKSEKNTSSFQKDQIEIFLNEVKSQCNNFESLTKVQKFYHYSKIFFICYSFLIFISIILGIIHVMTQGKSNIVIYMIAILFLILLLVIIVYTKARKNLKDELQLQRKTISAFLINRNYEFFKTYKIEWKFPDDESKSISWLEMYLLPIDPDDNSNLNLSPQIGQKYYQFKNEKSVLK